MAEHPNVQRLRDGYASFAKGDLDTVKTLWTDDVVWHVGGDNPVAGDYKGQDEILGFFGKVFELTGGTLKIDVHDILANDEHAVALVALSGKRDGKSIDMNAVHVFHLREGKTSEFWGFNENDRRADEFWS